MLSISHSFLLILVLLVPESLNSRPNFCDPELKCGALKNDACGCVPNKDCPIIMHNVTNFRRVMLNMHNAYRNRVAAGRMLHYVKANNMHVLKYDLELEHMCACRFKKNCNVTHDSCNKTPSYRAGVGQNLYVTGPKIDEIGLVAEEAFKVWFDKERTKLSYNLQLSFSNYDKHTFQHITQWLWWSATSLGCLRLFNTKTLEFYVCCSYGHLRNETSNEEGKGMYEINSEGCKKCPKGKQCIPTSKYPNLCGGGEIEIIPPEVKYNAFSYKFWCLLF